MNGNVEERKEVLELMDETEVSMLDISNFLGSYQEESPEEAVENLWALIEDFETGRLHPQYVS